MAWSTPRDWTQGELVTPANMDTYISDNLAETAPAKATAAGRVFRASAANAIEETGGVALIGNSAGDGLGGTLIVASIPTDYTHLMFTVSGEHDGAAATLNAVDIRLNADSGANYRWIRNDTADNGSPTRSSDITPDTEIACGSAPGLINGFLLTGRIHNYSASAARHIVRFDGAQVAGGGAGAHVMFDGMGIWEPASAEAVDQITIRVATDNWASGAVLTVYGHSI